MSKNKLSIQDLDLIRHLKNGRRPFKEVAHNINLSETTVRSRVTHLLEAGLLDISALVEPKVLPDGYSVAIVGIKLATTAMLDISHQLSKAPGVISVALVTGQYDLFMTILLTPNLGLIDFFNALLNISPGSIRSHETFMVYASVNFKLPYDESEY